MLPCNLPVWIDCCCSVPQSYPTLCDPMDYSRPASPVLHCLPEFAQTHVHWVDDAIQTSLSPPSPPATNLAQHQGLFQWVCPSHQVARVLELQFQNQTFQWIFRSDQIRMDWLYLPAVQGTLKSFLQYHNSKTSLALSFLHSPTLTSNSHIHTWLPEKP